MGLGFGLGLGLGLGFGLGLELGLGLGLVWCYGQGKFRVRKAAMNCVPPLVRTPVRTSVRPTADRHVTFLNLCHVGGLIGQALHN